MVFEDADNEVDEVDICVDVIDHEVDDFELAEVVIGRERDDAFPPLRPLTRLEMFLRHSMFGPGNRSCQTFHLGTPIHHFVIRLQCVPVDGMRQSVICARVPVDGMRRIAGSYWHYSGGRGP